MAKLIVTADIHGSYSSWLTVKTLLNRNDGLAIAGDLFDTKYGRYSNTDFQPQSIKNDLNAFKHHFYYVYGNCDTPSFFPGFEIKMEFTAFNKKILLYHGHRLCTFSEETDIIIQGHTHLCFLEKKDGRIFMNPGSITWPRNGVSTYGEIDKTSANLICLKTGEKLITIEF
ncbi:MAG: YfcE family phosphodiesterase [Deltaproteobacteria bacterium]|nr:YfcE family phosphodiesterase [Deltaproteobacteria bacterium]